MNYAWGKKKEKERYTSGAIQNGEPFNESAGAAPLNWLKGKKNKLLNVAPWQVATHSFCNVLNKPGLKFELQFGPTEANTIIKFFHFFQILDFILVRSNYNFILWGSTLNHWKDKDIKLIYIFQDS